MNYYKLISKYHFKVSAEVISGVNKTEITIGITPFESFPAEGEFGIITTRTWVDRNAIETMSPFKRYLLPSSSTPVNDDVLTTINSMIESRTSSGGQEQFIIYEYSKKDVTFSDILVALLHINNADITRCLIIKEVESVLLVIKDRHTIRITTEKTSDSSLFRFDVDDGFSTTLLSPYYDIWRENLEKTSYASWDTAILPMII